MGTAFSAWAESLALPSIQKTPSTPIMQLENLFKQASKDLCIGSIAFTFYIRPV